MLIDTFNPLPPLVGGVLIGLASSAMLIFNGRIAGISGIVGSLFRPVRGEVSWRLWFLVGLMFGGGVLMAVRPSVFVSATQGPLTLIASGLLVGFANGCTSGHGVCGNSRFSTRSIAATVTFIAVGAATVWVRRLVGG